ncbi:MAG: [Fe-Fe] hydrogenase large subunit C-terminal domain-containing protein [Oscillospiraceae bacterium]|nr:[Fe-Fe] hydrogenase large subunit C-terminal domain-containing protein [Oscillospiraceae bacterium]
MGILSFKKTNCRDCYKCVRECPVKSIRVRDHQAQIIAEECILCGRCVQVCPQNAKEVRDDVPAVEAIIRSGKRVVASLAPSYIAAFDTDGFAPIAEALKKLGFTDVQETAAGANVVKREYERLVDEGQPVIISSCCHSITRLIQKYHVDCLPYYAKVLSPMDAHGHLLREQYPDAEIVFIGPCISKKDEVEQYCKNSIDMSITFEELQEWFDREGITIDNSQGDGSRFRSRFFPETGGILKSMDQVPGYKYIAIDGIENCRRALQEIGKGNLKGYFIEMSACEGSCINGPGMPKDKQGILTSRAQVERIAEGGGDYDVEHSLDLSKTIPLDIPRVQMPGEAAIWEILRKTGKNRPEDMLNCGACGYSTCWEKAIAVYQGKAELEMCLPFMKERAESISDQVLDVSPNAIIAVDASFTIQQFNRAACRLMKIPEGENMVGRPIGDVYDEVELIDIMDSGRNILGEKCYLDRYGIYVDKSIIYDKDHNLLLIYLKDIDQEEHAAQKAAQMRRETVEITDQLINKQMRTVQEIASLLGETTAETKIALTRLKKSLTDDAEERA